MMYIYLYAHISKDGPKQRKKETTNKQTNKPAKNKGSQFTLWVSCR